MLCLPDPSGTGVAWADTSSFIVEMLCLPAPSEAGVAWNDSPLSILDMLCYDPSVTGMAYDHGNVFVLQFADLDEDADVDLSDFATFALCYLGPGAPPPDDCECSDLDGDEDVDLSDFAWFALNYTGAQ